MPGLQPIADFLMITLMITLRRDAHGLKAINNGQFLSWLAVSQSGCNTMGLARLSLVLACLPVLPESQPACSLSAANTAAGDNCKTVILALFFKIILFGRNLSQGAALSYGSRKDVSIVLITGNSRNVITVRLPDLMFPDTFMLGNSLNPSGSLTRLFSVISMSAR